MCNTSAGEEREAEMCQVNQALWAEWRAGVKGGRVRVWHHPETTSTSVLQERAVRGWVVLCEGREGGQMQPV